MSRCLRPGDGLILATSPVPFVLDSDSDTNQDISAIQKKTPLRPSKCRIASISLIGTIPYGAGKESASWQHKHESAREIRNNCRVTSRESVFLNRNASNSPTKFRRESFTLCEDRSDDGYEKEPGPHMEAFNNPPGSRNANRKRVKRKLNHELHKGNTKLSRRKYTNQLDLTTKDEIDHGSTLTEQISSAGEIVALAAHVEELETMGCGAGGRMPNFDILKSARELLGNSPADAPGLPGTDFGAFALCGVVGEVVKIMIADAVDLEDSCYGAEDLSLDLEDSDIFVSEDVVVDESLVSAKPGAMSTEKPELALLDWPGWFDNLDEDRPDDDFGCERKLDHLVKSAAKYRYPLRVVLFPPQANR